MCQVACRKILSAYGCQHSSRTACQVLCCMDGPTASCWQLQHDSKLNNQCSCLIKTLHDIFLLTWLLLHTAAATDSAPLVDAHLRKYQIGTWMDS